MMIDPEKLVDLAVVEAAEKNFARRPFYLRLIPDLVEGAQRFVKAVRDHAEAKTAENAGRDDPDVSFDQLTEAQHPFVLIIGGMNPYGSLKSILGLSFLGEALSLRVAGALMFDSWKKGEAKLKLHPDAARSMALAGMKNMTYAVNAVNTNDPFIRCLYQVFEKKEPLSRPDAQALIQDFDGLFEAAKQAEKDGYEKYKKMGILFREPFGEEADNDNGIRANNLKRAIAIEIALKNREVVEENRAYFENPGAAKRTSFVPVIQCLFSGKTYVLSAGAEDKAPTFMKIVPVVDEEAAYEALGNRTGFPIVRPQAMFARAFGGNDLERQNLATMLSHGVYETNNIKNSFIANFGAKIVMRFVICCSDARTSVKAVIGKSQSVLNYCLRIPGVKLTDDTGELSRIVKLSVFSLSEIGCREGVIIPHVGCGAKETSAKCELETGFVEKLSGAFVDMYKGSAMKLGRIAKRLALSDEPYKGLQLVGSLTQKTAQILAAKEGITDRAKIQRLMGSSWSFVLALSNTLTGGVSLFDPSKGRFVSLIHGFSHAPTASSAVQRGAGRERKPALRTCDR